MTDISKMNEGDEMNVKMTDKGFRVKKMVNGEIDEMYVRLSAGDVIALFSLSVGSLFGRKSLDHQAPLSQGSRPVV